MTNTNKQPDIKMEIQLTPDDHDSDNVFFMHNDKQVGFGNRNKETQKITIRRCPMCDRENYAIVEALGACAFCRFNPNE